MGKIKVTAVSIVSPKLNNHLVMFLYIFWKPNFVADFNVAIKIWNRQNFYSMNLVFIVDFLNSIYIDF